MQYTEKKLADRIAGAMLDLAYEKEEDPRVAVEVLLGHGRAYIIAETSVHFTDEEIEKIIKRISPETRRFLYTEVPQDPHLSKNQKDKIRCGDNGIFRGCLATGEQNFLTDIASAIWKCYKSDGKYIVNDGEYVICQSNAKAKDLRKVFSKNAKVKVKVKVNPIGDWTGGPGVDAGATNRKLGSDMGDAVTGGGLHGKDLSKADVSVNIFCHLMAQKLGRTYEASCAIGDEEVNGHPYAEIVEIARCYIKKIGGFEKFAEWGLIRPI